MAQEAFEKLTNEWTALSDKTTVDEDATYYIQNRGSDVLLAQEAGATPTSDNVNGVLVKPYEVAKYKVNGGDLYLRAYSSNCSVNITSDKTQTSSLWFDMTTGLTATKDEHNENEYLSKIVNGYDVKIDIVQDEEDFEYNTLTSEVLKDGASAGNSSIWFVIKDSNGEEVAKNSSNNMNLLFLDASTAFSLSYNGYTAQLYIVTDEETHETSFDQFSLQYNGEDFDGTIEIFVKLER